MSHQNHSRSKTTSAPSKTPLQALSSMQGPGLSLRVRFLPSSCLTICRLQRPGSTTCVPRSLTTTLRVWHGNPGEGGSVMRIVVRCQLTPKCRALTHQDSLGFPAAPAKPGI